MRRHGWIVAISLTAAVAAVAVADPKPSPVDIKPFRAELLVFKDAAGGTYVVRQAQSESRLFYGTGKTLYEQVIVGRSRNGDAWSINTWAPRIPQMRPAYFERKQDGTFQKSCDGKDDSILTQLTGDKAKAVLDSSQLMTEALVRRPHLLARDDAGVYYYVDRLANAYGGKGFRVFVGKKGAMKQLALTDVASDSVGEVFSTKTGDLRLTTQNTEADRAPHKALWIKGEKRIELMSLDLDVNSPVIFTELGIYKFIGTLCENV
jgi:hypothetical protein